MYRYEITLQNGIVFKFESKLHLTMLKPFFIPRKDGGKVTFVTFPDTGHTIDLAQIKKLKINGVKHQIKPYAVK